MAGHGGQRTEARGQNGATGEWSRWEARDMDGQTREGEALGKAESSRDIDFGPEAERVARVNGARGDGAT